MTTVQPSIFEQPITAGTARASDPWSSRQAAKGVRPGRAHRAIRDHFLAAGGTGSLDDACQAVTMLRGSVSRRLSDMEAMGWLRNTGRHVQGVYGVPLAVWQLTEKGRQA